MKKIVAIHDIAGLGRVSLGTVLPILSAMGAQVCPLPTSVLSSGTSGFSDFYFQDLTQAMEGTLRHWESLSLQVDAVYSGFLGSPGQVELVLRCAKSCLRQNGLFIVDPVMGDNGEIEPTMDKEMVAKMKELVGHAGCITPNLTEAALLLDEAYPTAHIHNGVPMGMLQNWLVRLCDLGPEIAIITSVPLTSVVIGEESAEDAKSREMAVIAYDRKGNDFLLVPYAPLPLEFPGSGDAFASVMAGALAYAMPLPESLCLAVDVILLAMEETIGGQMLPREGMVLGDAMNLLARARRSRRAGFTDTSRSRCILL